MKISFFSYQKDVSHSQVAYIRQVQLHQVILEQGLMRIFLQHQKGTSMRNDCQRRWHGVVDEGVVDEWRHLPRGRTGRVSRPAMIRDAPSIRAHLKIVNVVLHRQRVVAQHHELERANMRLRWLCSNLALPPDTRPPHKRHHARPARLGV